jgi:hypothetical protein
MFARIAILALLSTVFLLSFPLAGNAAMGLRCSDWLNARAWVRYDPRTNQYVQANPKNARPVPKDVDDKAALLTYYVSGIVETFTLLDPLLKQMADIPGLEMPPKLTLPAVLDRVEELCKGGLQNELRDYDALDIVSTNNKGNVMLRAALIQDLLQKFMDAGRQGTTRR